MPMIHNFPWDFCNKNSAPRLHLTPWCRANQPFVEESLQGWWSTWKKKKRCAGEVLGVVGDDLVM